ncbi:MAG: hypothetical protein ACU0AU_06820 [Cognatishimia activa]
MYIEEPFKRSVEQLLDFWYFSASTSNSKSLELCDAVARLVLGQFEDLDMTPRELSFAVAKKRACVGSELLSAEIVGAYKKAAFLVLQEFHCMHEPALDPDFVSFSFERADTVVQSLLTKLDLKEALIAKHYQDGEYMFQMSKEFGHAKDFSLNMSLYGRNCANPTLLGTIVIADSAGEAANFSLGKILGIGLWKPCKNNQTATDNELVDSFYEPMFLFEKLYGFLENAEPQF